MFRSRNFCPQTTASRNEDKAASQSMKELYSGKDMDPLDRLRLLCLSKGATGILAAGRVFRKLDKHGTQNLNFDQFFSGMKECGIELAEEEVREMFDKIADGDDNISLEKFLIEIRPVLNETRTKSIEDAFSKLDKHGDGEIPIEEVRRVYNVKSQSRYIAGEDSEESILKKFMENFETGATKDGKVTREEFFNYYAGVSASVDDDSFFDLMIRQAYKL